MISVLFIKSTQKALEREGEGEGSLVEATEIKDLDMVKRATFLLQGEQLAAAYGSVWGTVPSTQLHSAMLHSQNCPYFTLVHIGPLAPQLPWDQVFSAHLNDKLQNQGTYPMVHHS